LTLTATRAGFPRRQPSTWRLRSEIVRQHGVLFQGAFRLGESPGDRQSIPCWRQATPIAAVSKIKEHGVTDVRLAGVLVTPVGLGRVHERHPDLLIWTAAIQDELDEHGWIRPAWPMPAIPNAERDDLLESGEIDDSR